MARLIGGRRIWRKHGARSRGQGDVLNPASRTPWGLVGLLVAAGIVAAFHIGKVPPSIPSIRVELAASLAAVDGQPAPGPGRHGHPAQPRPFRPSPAYPS